MRPCARCLRSIPARPAVSAVILLGVLSAGLPSARAGLIWRSTFDSDADGVIDLENQNAVKVLIGSNTGGRQTITVAAISGTQGDRGGRATGTTLGRASSFSALYQFRWTALPSSTGTPVEDFAGFQGSSIHCTRQALGARLQHWRSGSNYIVNLGVGWGSVGYTYFGSVFQNQTGSPVNLGASAINRPLQLAIGYDGTTLNCRVALYDANTAKLGEISALISQIPSLGFAPNSPEVTNELNALALTHLGWQDFIADASVAGQTSVWSVDSLAYYDHADDAFAVASGTAPQGACCQSGNVCTLRTQFDCAGAWQGAGTACGPGACGPPPTGACCGASGACAITTSAACAGSWQGADSGCGACSPAWSSTRANRVLVRVDPVAINRASDEMVASAAIDFDAMAGGGRVNLSTIQVVGYSSATGAPVPYTKNTYATTAGEVPARFYDDDIPWNYPFKFGYAFNTNGTSLPNEFMDGGGRYFNALGNGRRGRLVWMHTQVGSQPSFYAVYYDVMGPLARLRQPPAGFVGDGSHRCTQISNKFFMIDHSRIDLADLSGDGLFDMIAGNGTGTVLLHENYGTPGQPSFSFPRMLFEDTGDPIDAGWSAAPRVVDWDRDGAPDILVGTEKESVLFFRNVGGTPIPRFHRMGLLQADGQPLRIPRSPCEEDPGNTVFVYDYYPVPEVVDWDGDGDLDLLLGGYITGKIWYYRNMAPSPNVQPQLTFMGALQADGQPLDVTWCAAPTVADFDGDGDLDIISGAMQISPGLGDLSDPTKFLWYYRNIGTRTAPQLTRVTNFPSTGTFAYGLLGTPRAVDYNLDGKLDLIISVRTDLLFSPNIGTVQNPVFSTSVPPVSTEWGNAALGFDQLLDYNNDGWADQFAGSSVTLNTGQGAPGIFGGSITLGGAGLIDHSTGSGDHGDSRILADLDGDGLLDILVGDFYGQIWFHRNVGSAAAPQFDIAGYRLQDTNGAFVQAELINPDPFDQLQGARTMEASGDFNHDGREDLVVCNTQGYIYLFVQASGSGPVYQPRVLLGRLHQIRLTVQTMDINDDGWDDIVVSYASGQIYKFVNRAQAGSALFHPAALLDLPEFSLAWPLHYVGDWNGDGDKDLLLSVFGILRYIERSFIDHGYIPAQVVGSQIEFGNPCHLPWADADGDGDVDLSDFGMVQACLTGRNDPGGIFDHDRCRCFDRDVNSEGLITGDSDVEPDELLLFLSCMGGPGLPPAPTCN